MNRHIINIALKLVLLGLMLVILNIIYGASLWFYDVDTHSDTLENLWPHQYDSDVIYFGESSNFYVEHPDTPKVRISDYLNRRIEELRINHVDNAGLQASNYLHIMRHIPKDAPLKGVVVTVNLRSFGPTWLYDANTNYLNKADELIKPRPKLLNRFFVALKAYDHFDDAERKELLKNARKAPIEFDGQLPFRSLYEWNEWMANGGIRTEEGKWDKPKISLACHHIKNFAFVIDFEKHPVIKSFDDIVELAQLRGWQLAFHILSENITEAEELVGPDLATLMEYNVTRLVEYYEAKGVLVVNNLRTVPEPEYRDRIFPTEHYNNYGKKLCAKKLEQAIRKRWTQMLEHE